MGSVADSSNMRVSTASALSTMPGGPSTCSLWPRRRTSTPRRSSTWRRFCSMGPANTPSRALSAASSDSSRDSTWAFKRCSARASRRRPRSEFGIASVISTSTKRPISAGGPSKFTQRLFSVRPASCRASLFDGRSTSTRCTEPTMRTADRERVRVDARLQPLEPRLLHLVRHVVRQRGSGRARAAAVDEAETLVEADLLDQAPWWPRSRAPSRRGSRR